AIVDVAGETPGVSVSGPVEPWIILVLDGAAIRTRILPELVRRRFGENGEYDVAIVRRADPTDVLYRTRPDFSPSGLAGPDAEAGLVAIRVGPGPPPGEGRGREEGPGPVTARINEGPRVHEGPGAPGRGAWALVASHRAGSLQAAVTSIRRRNL